MRLKHIVNTGLVFFACMQTYAFATETRMDALGGISIAVFDKEQEALDNPARLPYIPRVTIVAKGVNAESKNTSIKHRECEWEDQYSWSGRNIGKTTSTLENINKSNKQQATLLCFIPLLNMGFLGGIEYDSNSSLYQYKDIGYSYDRYTSKSTISYDPSVYVAGFGMRLDRLSFGAGARITSEDPVKRYSESMYSYSWNGSSSTYQTRIDGIQYKGGITYVGDVMEFDAFGTYQPYTIEERILSRVQAGTVVTDYGTKNPNTSTGTITAATVRTRFKVSDATTIGLLASYSVQKIDSSDEHSDTSFYNSSYYTYSSTRTSSWNSKNNNEYSIAKAGLGIGIAPDNGPSFGCDIMVVQTRSNYIYNYQYEYHYEDSDGDHRYDKHIDTRNQKIENYYLDIKLGAEKALSSKFTGRIGGEIVKLLSAKNTTEEENVYLYNSLDSYYGNDSSNEYSKTTTTIDSEDTTPHVSFTAGLAYQLCKAITLEYSYVSAYLPFEFTTTGYSSLVGGDAHQVSATLRF